MVGIYACNQMPSITLDANFDQSTACNIPAAYIDTHIGQLLINLDYMIKVYLLNIYSIHQHRLSNNMDAYEMENKDYVSIVYNNRLLF